MAPVFLLTSPVVLISFLYPCSYSFCAIIFPYHGLARASLEIQIHLTFPGPFSSTDFVRLLIYPIYFVTVTGTYIPEEDPEVRIPPIDIVNCPF